MTLFSMETLIFRKILNSMSDTKGFRFVNAAQALHVITDEKNLNFEDAYYVQLKYTMTSSYPVHYFSGMDSLVTITFRVTSREHKSNEHFSRVRSLGQVMRNTFSAEQQHTSNAEITDLQKTIWAQSLSGNKLRVCYHNNPTFDDVIGVVRYSEVTSLRHKGKWFLFASFCEGLL